MLAPTNLKQANLQLLLRIYRILRYASEPYFLLLLVLMFCSPAPQDSEQYRSNPPAPASQLAKKILARPPSLNGPPGPPIPMKFVVLPPIATEADAEDTSDESVSDAAVSTRTASLSSSTCHTSGDDNSEMDEPTLRPLTVPPWHMKSRRPNVCATAATSLQ